MDKRPVSRPEDNSATDRMLAQIHDGMDVRDRDGKDIGKVDGVYFGEVSAETAAKGKGPATARDPDAPLHGVALARNPAEPGEPFAGDVYSTLRSDKLPQVLWNRLLRLGFVRITGGLFSSPRYALPNQIAGVQDNRVELKVSRDELIKQ